MHAFLSPSSSERWYHCTRSAWLCEQFPDLGSVFAAEGTEAHRLCEFLLHEMLGISKRILISWISDRNAWNISGNTEWTSV
ncbi:MAG: DUF2800 domain-containing protein [Clostridiales bacterium]|nr:DUF2800 domain-containing protein [Clostridiales bacterium]